MKLSEVIKLQEKMLNSGSPSSACGRYQFLRGTLRDTMSRMGLNGQELWTSDLQDQMAVNLMEQRGLQKYLDGYISAEMFANNLSMEWASLPVVSPIKGKTVGHSYYDKDGLNKSFHTPQEIMTAIAALKNSPVAVPVTAPKATPSYTPSIQLVMTIIGLLVAIVAAVLGTR